jgi:hypothetical protein
MPVIDRRSAVVLLAGAAVIAAVGGKLLDRFYADPAFLKPHDFMQYWAAGRLNISGGNPYDADQVVELQKAAVRDEDRPTLMWNPPWALALTMPFGSLPMRTGQLCWLLAQLAAVVWVADAVWRVYGGPRKLRPLVCGGAILFYPVMYVIFLGQSGGWLLLGLAAFLVAAARGPLPIAALAALCALKPHLFVPFWLCLALNATRSRRGAALLGWGVLAGLAATLAAWAVNPAVWEQYVAAVFRPETANHRPLEGWKHPLIGYHLRFLIDPAAFWIQMVPTAAAAFGTVAYWWVRRKNWDWAVELPRLLFVGMIAAPYGAWEHDQLVLLIPVLSAAARLATAPNRVHLIVAVAVFVMLNAFALTRSESPEFIWLPPALLAWYGAVMWFLSADPGLRVAQQGGFATPLHQSRERLPVSPGAGATAHEGSLVAPFERTAPGAAR